MGMNIRTKLCRNGEERYILFFEKFVDRIEVRWQRTFLTKNAAAMFGADNYDNFAKDPKKWVEDTVAEAIPRAGSVAHRLAAIEKLLSEICYKLRISVITER